MRTTASRSDSGKTRAGRRSRCSQGRGDDDGFVGLILKDAPLIELGDSLQPGVRMTPAQARLVAAELVKLADRVEECPMHDGSGFKCALHRGHGGECMGLGELFE